VEEVDVRKNFRRSDGDIFWNSRHIPVAAKAVSRERSRFRVHSSCDLLFGGQPKWTKISKATFAMTARIATQRSVLFEADYLLDLLVSSHGFVPRDRRSRRHKILAGIRRTAARVECIATPHIQNSRRRWALALNRCRRFHELTNRVG